MSIDERRRELLAACLRLMGERPWAEVSIADVAEAAGASTPLVYHYFPGKRELYVATVTWAAAELRAATVDAPPGDGPDQLRQRIAAHVAWIDAHADAYRAVLQGGISSDPDVQAIVEQARTDVVHRLARAAGLVRLNPSARITLRGWVGFLEGATLDWLAARDLSETELVELLVASAGAAVRQATRAADDSGAPFSSADLAPSADH